MDACVAIDLDALPELGIRMARDAWLEELDAAAAGRPLSEVELVALARDVDGLEQERPPP